MPYNPRVVWGLSPCQHQSLTHNSFPTPLFLEESLNSKFHNLKSKIQINHPVSCVLFIVCVCKVFLLYSNNSKCNRFRSMRFFVCHREFNIVVATFLKVCIPYVIHCRPQRELLHFHKGGPVAPLARVPTCLEPSAQSQSPLFGESFLPSD